MGGKALPFDAFDSSSMGPPLNSDNGAAVYKPGEIVQASGIYETVGGREATLSKGDRFPPTAAGATWKVVRLAKTTARRRSTSSTGTRKGRQGKRGG